MTRTQLHNTDRIGPGFYGRGRNKAWEYDVSDYMEPWRIHGESADLTFTPFYDKVSSTNLLVLAGRTHQLFGHYSGWMRDDSGQRIRVDGLLGFAEDVHNRW